MGIYRIVDIPTPYKWARPRGEAGAVTWVIVHSPEAGPNAANTARYLVGASNHGQTGYHELVGHDGTIYRMAPPGLWVGHAGIGTRIPGTNVRGVHVNYRTWSISINNVVGQRPPEYAIIAASQRVADVIVQLGLPDAGVVLAHREVSVVPGRRSDPTGVDMEWFRSLVHDALAVRRARVTAVPGGIAG